MALGRLERVEIRSYWANEERDFTPWLAREENIQILSEEIDIDIEVDEVESLIGSYRADIVGKDRDGRVILIENQLEKTDHKHLGQIITYASGKGAKVVIWITGQVTEEHRRAIDWLNEVTKAELAFFVCEIELWRIGDSKPAPRFKIVASPNEWSKSVQSAVENKTLSSTKLAHLDFWNGFKSFMEEKATNLRLRTPRPQHWYSIAVGKSFFHISLTTNTQLQRIGCELYIRGEHAKSGFAALINQQEEIEVELGELEWQELPEGQDCRIIVYQNGNSLNADEWPALHEWLKERAESFYRVFHARVKLIDLKSAS